ncbi:MAG: hypothetical protein P1P84_24665, partial [Deferrisomatales bacterium]|nr:hypothetical protein [Deferrisomatales bacterium]
MPSTTGCRAASVWTLLGVAVLVASASAPASAKDLGQVGRIYPIAEPDALQEIEERAAAIRWEEVLP